MVSEGLIERHDGKMVQNAVQNDHFSPMFCVMLLLSAPLELKRQLDGGSITSLAAELRETAAAATRKNLTAAAAAKTRSCGGK